MQTWLGGVRMHEFLANPVFRYGVFPLGCAVLGVLIKIVTRNDQYKAFVKEDFAVGLELMLTACLMFVLLTTDRALALMGVNARLKEALEQNPPGVHLVDLLQDEVAVLSESLSTSGWTIALMFLGLWSVSTIVRKFGWSSATELKPAFGIATPLVTGVMYLVVVTASTSP